MPAVELKNLTTTQPGSVAQTPEQEDRKHRHEIEYLPSLPCREAIGHGFVPAGRVRQKASDRRIDIEILFFEHRLGEVAEVGRRFAIFVEAVLAKRNAVSRVPA